MFGCRIILRILISLLTLSTSASSTILLFSRILTATYRLSARETHLLSGQDVRAELNFTESTLTDRLADDVVPYTLCLLMSLPLALCPRLRMMGVNRYALEHFLHIE